MNKRLKVLLAVSDQETARELEDAIARQNWEIVRARDALSAMAAILRERPDAVVLVGPLPGGGSVLTLRKLRASVHTTMTPVIAIAGLHDSDVEELRLHGVDMCLTPPADPQFIVD